MIQVFIKILYNVLYSKGGNRVQVSQSRVRRKRVLPDKK